MLEKLHIGGYFKLRLSQTSEKIRRQGSGALRGQAHSGRQMESARLREFLNRIYSVSRVSIQYRPHAPGLSSPFQPWRTKISLLCSPKARKLGTYFHLFHKISLSLLKFRIVLLKLSKTTSLESLQYHCMALTLRISYENRNCCCRPYRSEVGGPT